jgi:hypothetical protein
VKDLKAVGNSIKSKKFYLTIKLKLRILFNDQLTKKVLMEIKEVI